VPVTLLYGCDVSTFQAPGLVDWTKKDFGIVRATYGGKPDAKALAHVERIRDAGKIVGLYHFLLPQQAIAGQVDSFCRVADAARLGPGDMLPCIDIEDYPDQWSKVGGLHATHWQPVAPAWVDPLAQLVEAFDAHFGGCILYVTQRDWARLGKPAWVLQRPLWVANYPGKGATSPLKAPATPGGCPWRIWQWLVGPLNKQLQDHTDPRAVDQNVASSPLPLIAAPETKPEPEVTPEPYEADRAIPYVLLSDEDWDEMRVARDEAIHRRTEAEE
jgi:GH25 family lysozyme M1 (1,4-beta-N-acetylmuramidase)